MASVRKRTLKSGAVTWQLDYSDPDGRRIRRSFSRKADADAERGRVEAEMRDGIYVSDDDAMTVAECFEKYCAARMAGSDGKTPWRERTARDNKRRGERYILNARIKGVGCIGDLLVDELTRKDIYSYRDWLLTQSGAGTKTAKEAFVLLKSTLGHGLVLGAAARNVWSDLSTTTRKNSPVADEEAYFDTPTIEEFQTLKRVAKALRDEPVKVLKPGFFDAEKQPGWRRYYDSKGPRGHVEIARAWRTYYVMFLTLAMTGIRPSECRGLRAGDINLTRRTIRIKRSLDRHRNVYDTKTAAGRRAIPLTDELRDELKAFVAGKAATDYVFTNTRGHPVDDAALRNRMWKRLLQYAGVRPLRLYSLRNFFCAMLLQNGYAPHEVKEIMGHEKIETTMEIYARVFPPEPLGQAARINSVFLLDGTHLAHLAKNND